MIGGYFDKQFSEPTQKLWQQMKRGHFEFVTSVIVIDEIEGAPECVRLLFEETFSQKGYIIDMTSEIESLAKAYLAHKVVPMKFEDDAFHVAACVVSRVDYLVSWNFKHLVNVSRSDAFNAVNLLQGYPQVRIVNPLELIYAES